MSIRNLILGVNSATVSYLIHYNSLLQNATEIYYKMRQVFYYKMRQFYYKMRQLLQIATILLQNATFIINYKLQQHILLSSDFSKWMHS